MAKLSMDEILDAIGEMSLIEVSELVKKFEEKFGVSAAAPVAVAAGAAPTAAEAAEDEEKTEFDVILKEIGSEKIKVIKEVRALTGLGLKEAKAVVDGAPGPIREGIDKEEAAKTKETLEAVGATVEIK
jgi:large subunit ribosomal protein L7/L12